MADIGDKLRSAREAKGLTIADIEKTTKIQGRYLQAIEQNDFDKLPGDFYARAFIRQYAQIVGLDGKELLSEYHKDVPEAKPDEYVENSIDNKSKEVRETTGNKRNLWKNYLPRIAVILGIVIVILVVYLLYARMSSGGQDNNQANNHVRVSSQSSSSKKKAKPAVKKQAVRIIKIANNEYRVLGMKKNRRLSLKAGNQAIATTVAINGLTQYQNTLAAKQKHVLLLPRNAKTVVITLGNDNGTAVKIAGKRVPYVPTGSSLQLTLLIGKKQKRNKSNKTTQQTQTSGSGTNSNGTNSNRSNSTQNRQRQNNQRQSRRTQSSTQSSTQSRQSSQTQSSTQSGQSSTTTTKGSTGDNGK